MTSKLCHHTTFLVLAKRLALPREFLRAGGAVGVFQRFIDSPLRLQPTTNQPDGVEKRSRSNVRKRAAPRELCRKPGAKALRPLGTQVTLKLT